MQKIKEEIMRHARKWFDAFTRATTDQIQQRYQKFHGDHGSGGFLISCLLGVMLLFVLAPAVWGGNVSPLATEIGRVTATDDSGNIYMGGVTKEGVGVVQMYAPDGKLVWKHKVGLGTEVLGLDVHPKVVDAKVVGQYIVVSGYTTGLMASADGMLQTKGQGKDAFVRMYEYDPVNDAVFEHWTRLFGTDGEDEAWAVKMYPAGLDAQKLGYPLYIHVAGLKGGVKGFVAKYALKQDPSTKGLTPEALWEDVFQPDTSTKTAAFFALGVDDKGRPWATGAADEDLLVRRYQASELEQGVPKVTFQDKIKVDGLKTRAFALALHPFTTTQGQATRAFVAGMVTVPDTASPKDKAFLRMYEVVGEEPTAALIATKTIAATEILSTATDAKALAVKVNGLGQPYVAGLVKGSSATAWIQKYDMEANQLNPLLVLKGTKLLGFEAPDTATAAGDAVYALGFTQESGQDKIYAVGHTETEAYVRKLAPIVESQELKWEGVWTRVHGAADPVTTVDTPNPVTVNTSFDITATVETKKTTTIKAARYTIDGGEVLEMVAIGGTFNQDKIMVVKATESLHEPGVYTICMEGVRNTTLLLLTDTAVAKDYEVYGKDDCVLQPAFDPAGGFVTGGGWIWSPLGAYTDNPGLEGKATFGFVSKLLKNAKTPTGQTEFQFSDLNFHSDTYEWLVVANHKAQYKGTGTINGTGPYKFMLWAVDNDLLGKGDPDTFRIKIWKENEGGTETVIYDNGAGQQEDSASTQLGGGNIVVHVN